MVFTNIIRLNKLAPSFNTVFKELNKDVFHWFPGHMDSGMKRMQQKLLNVDCIIEVHDARIPFSGRNPLLMSSLCQIRPHILVLNKKDLCDMKYKSHVKKKLRTEQNIDHIIFTNCKDDRCAGVQNVFPLMEDLIKSSDRYNRANKKEHNVMIVGVTNVGKSSLLNTLRNRNLGKSNATLVGAVPGITRGVSNKIKICEDPPVYVFDTPGITTPSIPHMETGLKMAACNILQDHLVGEAMITQYILYWLNKFERYEYVEVMKMKEPIMSSTELLVKYAVKINKYLTIKGSDGIRKSYPNVLFAANEFNKFFRNGDFGRILLDKDLLYS